MKNNKLHLLLLAVSAAFYLYGCRKDDASPGENILYQDDFSSATDDRWPTGKHDEVQAEFKIEGGHYAIENKKAATFYMGINRFTAPQTDSLAWEIRVKIDTSALASPDYGIWLYREEPSSAIAAFYINEKGQFSVVVAETGSNGQAVTAYKSDWTPAAAVKPGEYNRLRIEKQGDTYRFLVNGKQLDQFTDKDHLHLKLPAIVVGPLTGILVDYVKVTGR